MDVFEHKSFDGREHKLLRQNEHTGARDLAASLDTTLDDNRTAAWNHVGRRPRDAADDVLDAGAIIDSPLARADCDCAAAPQHVVHVAHRLRALGAQPEFGMTSQLKEVSHGTA